MKFFWIHPHDKTSYSRRWISDETGLDVIKKMYETYTKNGEVKNRWDEFKVNEVTEMGIDYGGMINADEPNVKLFFGEGENHFIMKVSHLPYFLESLEDNRYYDIEKGVSKIGLRWWNLCLSIDFVQSLIPHARTLYTNCQEMIEGCEREFERKLGIINKDGVKVVSIRRKPNV